MISLRDIGLERLTHEEDAGNLKARLFSIARGSYRRPRKKLVLAGINVEIARGEKVAIIGANGAGKSTLLKLICGVLEPTTGIVDVRGRVAPLLELGAGFDPELPVVDNVILYGVLLGISKAVIKEHVDSILQFAELEEYRAFPVSALSSGMLARLGFAIATEIPADILLVDEILSVGDQSFKSKSRARLDTLWHEERTVVLVSHDLPMIESICNRAILIEHGRIAADGKVNEVVRSYAAAAGQDTAPQRAGSQAQP